MVDPHGEVYIISKVHGGNARFAHLPASGWGTGNTVTLHDSDTVHLHLHTDHNDPQVTCITLTAFFVVSPLILHRSDA
jgi:hypothetical protein